MLAIVGSLALVASACSNDDDGGGGSDETGSTGSEVDCATVEFGCVEVAAGDPIEIGTLLSISGATKSLGLDSQYGVRLAVDYLDGKFDGVDGQIDGHAVKLVNVDDGCSAEGGQTGATTLAADPQIVGVIGTSCSSASLGVADKILSAKGITTISPSATNPALTEAGTHQPYWFRTAHNDRIQAAVVSDYAVQKLKAKTAVTIHDESPYTQGLTDAFKADFEAAGGTVTDEEAINSADTDFKSLLTKIAQNPPDVIYAPDFNAACGTMVKQKAGVSGLANVTFMTSDGCSDSTFPTLAGSAATGRVLRPRPVVVLERRLLQEPVPARLREPVRLQADLGVPRARVRRLQHHGEGDHGLGREEQRRIAHDLAGGPEGRGRVDQELPGHHRHADVHTLGDCATSVTIAIYIYPNASLRGPDGQAGVLRNEDAG